MSGTRGLNKVMLLGNVGQSPETRVLPQSGQKLVKFSLATNERVFNKTTNEAVEKTEWHKIVVWGPLADVCEKYLSKGKQVFVEGKIQTRSWQDKDGNKHSMTEINAQNIILLGRREEGGFEAPAADPHAAPDFPMEGDETAHGSGTGGEDDVPF